MSLVESLQSIVDRVHAGFKYEADCDAFGVRDHWGPLPDSYSEVVPGDCEEFARRCCVIAREAGLPARLVMCGVRNPKGDHLVCEVNGYILDNRFNDVHANTDLNYTWISISGFNPGDDWLVIERVRT